MKLSVPRSTARREEAETELKARRRHASSATSDIRGIVNGLMRREEGVVVHRRGKVRGLRKKLMVVLSWYPSALCPVQLGWRKRGRRKDGESCSSTFEEGRVILERISCDTYSFHTTHRQLMVFLASPSSEKVGNFAVFH